MTSSEGPGEVDALLLPFLVNGTLDPSARARVHQYLDESGAARDEAAFLDFVRSSLKEIDRVEESGEAERREILQRIERYERRWGWREHAPWALAAAASAVALCEAVALAAVAIGPATPATPGRESAAADSASGASSGRIAVQFANSASAKQIRDLLVERKLTVVEGPDELGVYRVQLHSGADAAAVQTALAALRANPIVWYSGIR